MKLKLLFTIILFNNFSAFNQILTKEDSLSAGLVKSNSSTVISGYGNFRYSNNITKGVAQINLDRLVVFMGHKFTNKISFFSELEIEDAKITGGELGGEFALEQAFIKFDINRNNYISAGLFIPRLGIINENHLPTTFNGNDRPFVETFVIPSTWRELGVSYYGTSQKIPGLNYSLALVNGLNSSAFESGTGIREGRYEGRNASASCVAVTGALLYYRNHLRAQVSSYFGGSAGITKHEADSLQLNYGMFGTPVSLSEANIQYKNKGLTIKALCAFIDIMDASSINRAYANNSPEKIMGFYGEIGYNLLHKKPKSLTLFSRYENINMNLKIPENGILNEALNQQYIVSGLSFQPHAGVMIKIDYSYRMTGEINPLLIVNPYPQSQPFFKNQHFINLGLGYSF
ncbi:MAG: hypothetical protein HYR91_01585 [Flavobacteriia bacterium]|nr:hypothetical protein [Flavobacteriia bacterium]